MAGRSFRRCARAATWALRSSSQNPNSEAARTIDAVAGKLLDMSARRIWLPVVNIAKPS